MHGAEHTARWIGTSDGAWNDPANWDIGVVPNNSGADVYNVNIYGPPVTIRLETSVTVRDFTFNSDGVISNNVGLTVKGTTHWVGGTFAGTGVTILEGDASIGTVPPFPLVLDKQRLSIHGDATLRAPIKLRNAPAPLMQIHLSTLASLQIQEEGGFEVLPGSTQPTLENKGALTIKASPAPIVFPLHIENYDEVEIEERTFNLNGQFTQYDGVLRLRGANLPPYPTASPVNELRFYGGSLEGTGHVAYAFFQNGSSPPSLRGQFTFHTLALSLLDPDYAPTMVVALGGRDAGQFSRYEVWERLVLGGRVSIHFTNGFQASVLSSDVFEFLTPSPTCEVFTASPPGFLNAPYGTRINTEDLHGAFTLDRTTPGTEALALKDFGLIPFQIEFSPGWNNPNPGTDVGIFPIPSTRFTLCPSATLANPASHSWAGGSIEVSITSGFDSAYDLLNIQSISNSAPGNIWVDGATVRYGGVAIGTTSWVPGPGVPKLTCTFNANASDAAVEAVLRRLTYNPSYVWPNFFNDIHMRAPSRDMRLTLQNGVGVSTNVDFTIEFPHLVDLTSVSVWATNGLLMTIYGRLSNREAVQIPNILIRNDEDLGFGGFLGQRNGPSSFTIHANEETYALLHFTPFHAFTNGAPFHLLVRVEGGLDNTCVVVTIVNLSGSAAPYSKLSSSDVSLGSFYALESLMNQSAEGRRLAQLYWQHTAEVSAMIRTNSALRQQVLTTLLDFQPALLALLAGRGNQQSISTDMIDRLNSVWTNISADGSSALQTAMQTERARFNGFQNFVGNNFNQWATNLQFNVPTQPYFTLREMRRSTNGRVVELRFNEIDGWNPSLWRATNVTGPWQQLTNALQESFGYGMSHFLDTNAPALDSAVFYQLRATPEP